MIIISYNYDDVIDRKEYEILTEVQEYTDVVQVRDKKNKVHNYSLKTFIKYLENSGVFVNPLQIKFKYNELFLV